MAHTPDLEKAIELLQSVATNDVPHNLAEIEKFLVEYGKKQPEQEAKIEQQAAFNYGYNEIKQDAIYLENQELKRIIEQQGIDAAEGEDEIWTDFFIQYRAASMKGTAIHQLKKEFIIKRKQPLP